MRTVSYPSDLTGFQWSLIKPHLPVYPGGRPRKTDLRDVVDAIFYILRTGCQWRYLPKDFPPKSTVWRYFNQWRHNGTLETIHDLLRRKVRAAEKPYSPRTSASVDSQSVDTTSGGEQRGRDNAKNVDGRKRHIVVDSMGLLMAVLVTAASIDDAKAAAELFARLDGQPMSHVKRMYADSKYHNFILYEWVETNAAWELNIVQRPKDAVGWVLLPIRWTVERTFAWLGRCRRLSKDREKSVRSSEAFVKLAMIHLMLNRLAPKKRMPSSTIVRRHKPTCGTDTYTMDSLISSSGPLKSSGTTSRPSSCPASSTPPGWALPDDRRGNEPGDRPVDLGDGHALAGDETVNEFRRVGLCFLKEDRGHPAVSEGPWSLRRFCRRSPVGAHHEPVLALPHNRTRSLGVVGRTEFIPLLRRRSMGSLKRNQRNGKHGMNSVLRRSHLGGARQLVCNHGQTGVAAPSEHGRLPPVLSCAHELAGAREFVHRRNEDGSERLAAQGDELRVHE